MMALDHCCQVQRHSHADRGHDLYSTPAVAVEALLRVVELPPGAIWEPACGRARSPMSCAREALSNWVITTEMVPGTLRL
jgi:hypothetical protein